MFVEWSREPMFTRAFWPLTCAAGVLLGRFAGGRAERPLDSWFDLRHHQFHRAHRRLARCRTDFEREAHMDRMGRADLANQLFGNRLDIADQEIVVDLFEWRLVGERLIDQDRTLHDLLPPPQARG